MNFLVTFYIIVHKYSFVNTFFQFSVTEALFLGRGRKKCFSKAEAFFCKKRFFSKDTSFSVLAYALNEEKGLAGVPKRQRNAKNVVNMHKMTYRVLLFLVGVKELKKN